MEQRNKEKRLISWEEFGQMCNQLALSIHKDYNPDIVVGIVKAGVLPGAVIASLFRKDFYTIKISRRQNDRVVHARPILFVPITDSVYSKKVLIVDWITCSGDTLNMAVQEVENKQAKEVRTCTLFVNPESYRPHWFSMETGSNIVCPWNQFVIEGDVLIPHPEY